MSNNVVLNAMAGGDTVAAYDDGSQKFQQVVPMFKGPATTRISQFAKNSAVLDANVDASGAKQYFTVAPEADQVFLLHRMIVSYGDTSGMSAQEYGNIGSAVTNGVDVQIRNASGLVQSLTDSQKIKTNAEWAAYCYDADLKTWGGGNELFVVRWSFDRFGWPIRLDGSLGEYFAIEIEDDFTGLLTHRFHIQGRHES